MAFSDSYWISPWLSMALCDSHSGSRWLSLPFSGILWPSLAHYCSSISRIQSLIGSQFPCLALSAAATMTHFLPLYLGGSPTINVTRLPTALQRQLEQVKSISSTKISEYSLTLDQPFQHTQLIIPNTVIIDHSCNLSASLNTASL